MFSLTPFMQQLDVAIGMVPMKHDLARSRCYRASQQAKTTAQTLTARRNGALVPSSAPLVITHPNSRVTYEAIKSTQQPTASIQHIT